MTPGYSKTVPQPDSAAPKDHQVRNMFSRIARTYDLLNRVLSFGQDQYWRKYAIGKLSIASPGEVIDLCGGTGDMTFQLLKQRPEVQATLTDFALPMLSIARKRMESNGSCAEVACADALQLPFLSERFDAAMCAFGIRNWRDVEVGLKEVHRLLKHEGEFVILEFLRSGNRKVEALKKLYLRNILPWMGFLASGNYRAYRYLVDSMEQFYSDEEFQAIIERNGFSISHKKRFFLGVCWCYVLKKTGERMG